MPITYRRSTRPSPTSEPPPPEGSQPRPALAACRGPTASCSSDRVVPATTTSLTIDQTGAVSTDLRRFEDIAFDHYGYFSQDIPLTSTTTTSTTPTVASTTAFTVTLPPVSAGNLFVSDLATGLSVTVTSVLNGTAGQPGFIPAGITVVVPVQGPGSVGVKLENPNEPYDPVNNPLVVDTSGATATSGGRIVQITPQGVVSDFAQGFDTSGGAGLLVVRRFGAIDHVLGGWHNPVGLGRSRHLAVQDHGKPGRLGNRNPDRAERPSHAGRSLRRSG